MAKKGGSWLDWVVLVVGVLMLGTDLGWWGFWTVGPWASAFVLYGLYKVL